MQKILFIFLFTISFFLVDTVSAETIKFNSDYGQMDFLKETIGIDTFNLLIDDTLSEYESKYMNNFPFYNVTISFDYNISPENTSSFQINLYYYETVPTFKWFSGYSGSNLSTLSFMFTNYFTYENVISRTYPIYVDGVLNSDFSKYENYTPHATAPLIYNYQDTSKSIFNPYSYYISNYSLKMAPISSVDNMPLFYWNDKKLLIPKYQSGSFSEITPDDNSYTFEPYYLYDDDFNVDLPGIVEVNLNDYAYVAISLKNYNQLGFKANFYVKGQFCATPVYNNGMTSKDEITNNKVEDRCSPYYLDFTPTDLYINDTDLKNKVIFYLKSYDTTKDNVVRINTSIFDISYISEEDADKPYVNVGGTLYPTIPFNKLPSSANKNEEENYVPGQVEDFDFTDIFTSPLEFLTDVWNSIVSVFDLINHFLSLLPDPLAIFLYVSFTLAIVLGIIKILL